MATKHKDLRFAKGQGLPGTYTERPSAEHPTPRTFEAGSGVPDDLDAKDLAAWQKEGYIVTPEGAEVRTVGGQAHDVPPEEPVASARGDRPESRRPGTGQGAEEGEGTKAASTTTGAAATTSTTTPPPSRTAAARTGAASPPRHGKGKEEDED